MATSTRRVSPATRRQAARLLAIFALGIVGTVGAAAILMPGALGPSRAGVGGPFRL